MAYYLHVFVTQGDTDNLRGTLLANYADPIPMNGERPRWAKALSAVAAP
jgi:hypothetical protein